MPLGWRIFVVNAAVFTVGTAIFALSPATVSFPIVLAEALVLTVGLSVLLLVNLVLLRKSLEPLARLNRLMHRVDLLRPGERIDETGPAEVRELGAVFNEMLDRLERERRQSGRDAVLAQEGERKRVAQELHDEIGQSLTAIMLELSRLAARAPQELAPALRDAQEAARASLDDVRRIAQRLRPETLDDLGLAPALVALAMGWSERTGVAVERSFAQDLPELDPETELVVFRVAQESLTNVARHSGASRVELRLERALRGVSLVVRDNGRGLNGAVGGSGIRGMRERALFVGGVLTVSSSADGAEVRLEVPSA